MSTAMTLFDNLGALDTANLPRSAAATLLDNIGGNFKRISIKGGAFRLMVGGKQIAVKDERYLDVVFVNAAASYHRAFYEGIFDEEAKTPPSCWSADGQRPAADVKTPQSASCATCKQNIKGSGQGDSRACRFSQRVAVVLENDVGGDVYSMSFPATSIWGDDTAGGMPLANYSEQLRARSIDPGHIVTRIRFDTDSATPKLLFSPLRRLDMADIVKAVEQGATEDAKTAITLSISVQDTPPALAAPTPVANTPAAESKPAKAVKMETDVPPPTVRSAAATAPAVNPELAKLVQEWGVDD